MIYSAFIVGFLGSLHCLGMCGPIALAIPVNGGSQWQKISGQLVYNTGRIFTYSLIGLVMGSLGWGLALATSQQSLSVIIGVGLLIMLLSPARFTARFSLLKPIHAFTSEVKTRFRTLLNQRSTLALFLLGLLNGLLPCGLVYMALAGAAVMGSSTQGMLYMALFGLGTLPMMLAVGLVRQWVTGSRRALLSRIAPGFAGVLALLLILRGLDLGIAGLSPEVKAASHPAQTEHQVVRANCCHK